MASSFSACAAFLARLLPCNPWVWHTRDFDAGFGCLSCLGRYPPCKSRDVRSIPACFKTPKQQEDYKKQVVFMIEKGYIKLNLANGQAFSGDPFKNTDPMKPFVVPRLGPDNIQKWHRECPKALEVSWRSHSSPAYHASRVLSSRWNEEITVAVQSSHLRYHFSVWLSLPLQVPNHCGCNCSHPVSQQGKRHVGGIATAAELSYLLERGEEFRKANLALKPTLSGLAQPHPAAGVNTRPNLDNPAHNPAVLDQKQADGAYRGGRCGSES